ncbi:MAG: glutathione S-transferase family protein [Proteobacteria bacterium]|nr:glutathione S-transferase family protein [Pseudomonadota bacterium]
MAGRDYIAGERFSLADIPLFTVMDFMKDAGQPLDRSLCRVSAWFDRINARTSVQARIHPSATSLKWTG